jgi:hypothetical protein
MFSPMLLLMMLPVSRSTFSKLDESSVMLLSVAIEEASP